MKRGKCKFGHNGNTHHFDMYVSQEDWYKDSSEYLEVYNLSYSRNQWLYPAPQVCKFSVQIHE